MGADPARTLVIEDSLTGIRAGLAAGMTVWRFTGGSHLGPETPGAARGRPPASQACQFRRFFPDCARSEIRQATGMSNEPSLQDEAARAGWLYYVAGMTQDQIAAELGVSRQRAQRLVSRAMAEGLIHVRLNHRIGACLDLEAPCATASG
jgi:predicted DNA-binding protein (UPF0251 family)